MIDLSRTRADLLAEIAAPEPTVELLDDITDPRVVSADACVRVHGHTRDDLFPLLEAALSERYPAVPRSQLILDLLMPLRNALGNAFKHGNGQDRAKAVHVEMVLSRKGALIAVTDEGKGFDVGLTFRRFQEQEIYFDNQGDGFRNLHRATSAVTYENGGRTFLLCFQPSMGEAGGVANPFRVPRSGPAGDSAEAPALRNVVDSQWIRTRLLAELPDFGNGRTKLESCRVYGARKLGGDNRGIRCVLRIADHDDRPARTQVLTGTLHGDEATATAAFEAATALYRAKATHSLRIPRPVAQLTDERRLVLYDFDPWMNLWEYLAYHPDLVTVQHAANRAGRALGVLHRSKVVLRDGEPDFVEEPRQAIISAAERKLECLPRGSDLLDRFRFSVQRIQAQARPGLPKTSVPIHGSLGWDCIHYGVDNRFYLYGFETCRRSDPGLDLGGFAADLLCLMLARWDKDAYRSCRDEFLSSYTSIADHPMDPEDLRPYVALAVSERLRRAGSLTTDCAERLLDVLDAA